MTAIEADFLALDEGLSADLGHTLNHAFALFMSSNPRCFSCSGEYAAFRSGEEAPRCTMCDRSIVELSDIRESSDKLICVECDDLLDEAVEADRMANLKEFFSNLAPKFLNND